MAAPTRPSLPAGVSTAEQSRAPTRARLLGVADAFTLSVVVGGRPDTVRLLGVGLPGPGGDSPFLTALAADAEAAMRELVGDRPVGLERGGADRDAKGRLLRYVWSGERLLNAELLRAGLGHVDALPAGARHADALREAEAEARAARRGLWSDPPPPTPTLSSALTPVADPCRALEIGAQPPSPVCGIKGKITDRGRRLYIVVGAPAYGAAVVDPARGERWFWREWVARSAGWEPAATIDPFAAGTRLAEEELAEAARLTRAELVLERHRRSRGAFLAEHPDDPDGARVLADAIFAALQAAVGR